MKFVPVTINVSAVLPAGTIAGETNPTPGAGLFTFNTKAAEIPPPGAGLITVSFNVTPAAK